MDYSCYHLVNYIKKGHLTFPFELGTSADTHPTHQEQQNQKCYMVIEVSGNENDDLEDQLASFSEYICEQEICSDVFVSQNQTQFLNIWDIRDSMGEVLAKAGMNISLDISLDIAEFQNIVNLTREKVGKDSLVVCGFGHIGDGNLH